MRGKKKYLCILGDKSPYLKSVTQERATLRHSTSLLYNSIPVQ